MPPSAQQVVASDAVPIVGRINIEGPPPGSPVQLTLSGTIRFDLLDKDLDAQEAGPLLKIGPGQWQLVDQKPALHQYTYAPVGKLETNTVFIEINTDSLVDKYLISPQEVREGLHSKMSYALEVPVPAAVFPWWALEAGVLSVLLIALIASRKLLQRKARSVDLTRDLARIRTAGRALTRAIRTLGATDDRTWARVPQLLEAAEKLATSARALRKRLSKAGYRQLELEVRQLRLEAAADDRKRELLAEKERTLAMLEPLSAEEKLLTARLNRIRTTLESLESAWATADTPSQAEAQKAEALLEAVSQEMGAAIATRTELNRL